MEEAAGGEDEDVADHVGLLLSADINPITRRFVARSTTLSKRWRMTPEGHKLFDYRHPAATLEQGLLDWCESASQHADDAVV